VLERFCTDFTAKAKEGGLDPVFGRDRELYQMVDILARRRKNNPIMVGEAGVGKTAVVEGLAIKIVQGNVPDSLKDVSLLGLDMGLLQAGAGVKGEFENRLKSIIEEIKASPKPIILFIDEAHTMIGAGGAEGGSDAANLLKPALARGELRTIAATTWSEYKKYFEKDPALARRFQPVKVEEPTVQDAIVILRGLKSRYEEAHGVTVRDAAIIAAAEYSSRYISGRQLPDKAVDLLDTSAARVKVLLTSKPFQIEDKEREIENLEREKRGLERDALHGEEAKSDRILQIVERLNALSTEVDDLNAQWKSEKELANKLIEQRKALHALKPEEHATEKGSELKKASAETTEQLKKIQGERPLILTEVNADIVGQVVCDWTGIPLGKVLRDEADNIMNMEANLGKRIRGQDQAIDVIGRAVRAAKAGLTAVNQPMGVFLLVGPSGVGKTETAHAIADLLFGGERFMVTINMSEFQESHSVSRLIGSPPGYVGYGQGGILTEAVRQKPYSVVLIDETEKAHLDVMNLFYQVFDKGDLSDGEGRVIDFKNTAIFLTSNLATDIITKMCANGTRPAPEAIADAIRPTLSKHFKPALLARMTIVPFFTLQGDFMKDIVKIKLDRLVARAMESHKIKLTYSDAVVDQIASRCNEVETGARNIDHILRGTILPQISTEIVSRLGKGDLPSELHLGLAADGTFTLQDEPLALSK
jgi:type VI secretion system protein VasG